MHSLNSEQFKDLPILVSFSGGRTSAFMAWYLKRKYPNRRLVFVFANTGQEDEETLIFVDQVDRNFNLGLVWIEPVTVPGKEKGVSFKIVNFETASRDGEPFADMVAKYGIPNIKYPHCSRQLKSYPIRNYARTIGFKRHHYATAIGIRSDEPKRLGWKTAKRELLFYPLATDFPVNKSYINSFWAAQPFNLNLPELDGNCKTCWKKSKRKLLTIAQTRPERFNFMLEMEAKYSHLPRPENRKRRSKGPSPVPPFYFFRDGMTAASILEEAAQGDFEPFKEETTELERLMFSDPELDYTDGCEVCEVF